MNANRILSELLGSRRGSGFAGGLAGGLASSLLVGKAGRKLRKQTLELGGLAAIAGLGYAAWRRYQEARGGAVGAPHGLASAPDELPAGFLPPVTQPVARDDLSRLLLQAMIAAARAAGQLDGTERRALFEHITKLPLCESDRAELFGALEKPVDVQELVAAAVSPERAVEIYTASLLAIDLDTAAERGYLQTLAGALGLPEALVAQIHREAGVSELAAAAKARA